MKLRENLFSPLPLLVVVTFNPMKLKQLILPAAICAVTFLSPAAQGVPLKTETPESFNKRMEWFAKAQYGMFIHFGLYSIRNAMAGRATIDPEGKP